MSNGPRGGIAETLLTPLSSLIHLAASVGAQHILLTDYKAISVKAALKPPNDQHPIIYLAGWAGNNISRRLARGLDNK